MFERRLETAAPAPAVSIVFATDAPRHDSQSRNNADYRSAAVTGHE